MYKRSLAFLLAAVLAFSPVMQVNAQMPVQAGTVMAEVSAEETEPEVTSEEPEEERETPSAESPAEETETPSAEPEVTPSAAPEETPSKAPEESATPEASEVPEEVPSENPEETPSATPEESASPEASENPEPEESPEASESPEPEESPEVSESPAPEEAVSPEASETPEASPETDDEAGTDINTEIDLEKGITGNIDLSEQTTDKSGEGWTWEAATKTFTMNGYHASRSKLFLPAGATVMLAKGSENTIDNFGYNYYGIYGHGDLIITGDGKLTMTYENAKAIECASLGYVTFSETNLHFIHPEGSTKKPFPYRHQGVKVFASNITVETDEWAELSEEYITIKGSTITTGTTITAPGFYDRYLAVLNEETGLYEWKLKRDAAYVTKQPQRITELTVGQSATLSLAVKNTTGSSVKYQWYRTENYRNPTMGATKIADAIGKKLTVKAKSRGIEYYYCEITAGKKKTISDCAAVVAANKGFKICTSGIETDQMESVDKLEEEGYKWDKETKTLTIKDMDLLVPFGNYKNIRLDGGDTLVVEGTNYLNSTSKITLVYEGDEGETDVVITGPGSITLDKIEYVITEDGVLTLSGGIKMYLNMFGDSYGNIVMDNATCYAGETDTMSYGRLTLKNGSYLEVDSAFQVNRGIQLESGSKMFCGKYLTCFDNVFVGEDCKLIIEEYLTVWAGRDATNTPLTVNGTLQIKPQKTAYTPIDLRSYTEQTLVLGEGVRVISPEGAVWTKKSESSPYYAFRYQDSFLMNGLTIGKEAVTSKKITGSKEITGTPKYGNTLKIGTIDQKNAPVSYRWQYAETPAGPWTDIFGAKSPTYQVETKLHGYYVRAVIRGLGEYKGEIISNPVGPVVGNQAALYGVWGTAGSEGFVVGDTPFDGDNTYYSYGGPISGMSPEGTVTYHAMPVNSKATVTIKNNTTGFSKVGKVAEVPVTLGKNEIVITVKNGTNTMEYLVYHTIKDVYYTLELDTDYAPNYPGPVTASWVEDGEVKSITVEEEDGYRHKSSIKAGTEVTITSEPAAGTYTYRYIGLGAKPAKNEPGYPATFIMKEDIYVEFDYDCVKAYPPEGLTANWLLQEDAAEIKVKAVTDPDSNPGKYLKNTLTVKDENGVVVSTKYLGGSYNTTVTDGYFTTTVTGLDSKKSYQIEVINSNYLGDIVEGTEATYTLKPRKPVRLSVEKDYVVLKPNTTGKVKIIYEGRSDGKLTLENNFDTAVVDASGTKIVTAADGTGELQIKAKGAGTTYLTIRGEDYKDVNGSEEVGYAFTTLRVDVSSVEDAESLKLGTKTGTLNYYDDSALTIPVYQMDCGYPIIGAVFSDAALNEKLAITVVNDRTLKIVPKVPVDDGVIDYSKWLAESGRTGTFSSKIKVNYKGAASKESSEKLKITLTAKKPEVSVSALSFNSFYTNQVKNLKVTVKGEKVAKVQVDTAKNTGTKMAIPAYLSLKEADCSVRFNGNTVPAKSANTSIYLKVWPEGYRIPLQTKATVKVSYQKPKLKLKDTTITVMKQMEAPVNVTILPADKNAKYADLGVQSVRLMNESELIALSLKERRSYLPLDYFQVDEFDAATGVVTLDYEGTAAQKNGKVALYVNISQGKEPVKVTFNLKFVKPTLTAAKNTITMDSICGGYGSYYDEQYVKLKTNIDNYKITYANLTTKILKDGDKTGTDYSPYFDVRWDAGEKALHILHKEPVGTGTYKLYAYLKGVEKPAVITIKMIRSKTPALSATKSEISISRLMDDAKAKQQVTIFVPEKFKNGYKPDHYPNDDRYKQYIKISNPDGTSGHTYLAIESEGWDNKKHGYKYTISAPDSAPTGTYKVTFEGYLYGATNNNNVVFLKPVTVKVKVTDSAPVPKTPATVTLNKDLQSLDAVRIPLSCSADYEYRVVNGEEQPWEVASVTDANGKDASAKLDYTLSAGALTIKTNENTVYGATYKVKLALCYENNVQKSAIITVKIPKKNAAISAKAKVIGSIDLTRETADAAQVVYTFTNWNSGSTGVRYEWEVYAKNGKKAVTTAGGALDNKGLVAKGSYAGSQKAGSWFKNTDYNSGVKLRVDRTSDAWKNQQIAAHYTYTVKAKLVFMDSEKTVKLPDVKLTVKNGAAKYALAQNTITLVKADEKGRAFITINNKKSDYADMMDIAYVEVVNDKNVPVSKAIEVVPSYQTDRSAAYEVRWKNLKAANVKSGTVKLRVYLEGNNPKWKKPNATLSLKVNIK